MASSVVSRILNGVQRRLLDQYSRLHGRAYSKLFYDGPGLQTSEDQKFGALGWDVVEAQRKLDLVLTRRLSRPFDRRHDSVHWLVASALTERSPRAERILEIGTYLGEFASILAGLFPDASITTVDLPDQDPRVQSTYMRDGAEAFKTFVDERERNLNHSNITCVRRSSFHLREEVQGEFDLIWVDGWHLYPQVAWDLCNAYHLLGRGGVLMCDDVIQMRARHVAGYVSSESFEVLQQIEGETQRPAVFFLKRMDALTYARVQTRKYVAYWAKP